MTPTQEQLDARKEWVKDLRSNKFKQGKHTLCSIDEEGEHLCCLMVAIESYNRFHNPLYYDIVEEEIRNTTKKVKSFNGNYNYLPSVVASWLGISEYPIVPDGTHDFAEFEYSYLNDHKDLTFNDIADLIEKGLIV